MKVATLASFTLLLCCAEDARIDSNQWSLEEPPCPSCEPEAASDATLDAAVEEPIARRCDGALPPETTFTPGEGDAVTMSVAVGPDGCPRVLYYQEGALRLARWDGAAWSLEVVPAFASQSANISPDYPLALYLDERGRETVFATASDSPRTIALPLSSEGGGWSQQEIPVSSWSWEMRAFTDDGGDPFVIAYTSDERYSGENITARLFTLIGEQRWSSEPISDFDIKSIHYLSVVSDGRGGLTLPLLESKGYSKSDQETNLWLATSPPGSPRSWSRERVVSPLIGRVGDAILISTGETLHLFAFSSEVTAPPSRQRLAHARRGEKKGAVWSAELVETCEGIVCRPLDAFVDERGRVHLLFGRHDADLEGSFSRVMRGVWSEEGAGWRLDEVGVFMNTISHQAAYDSVTGVTHFVAARRPGEWDRSAVYVAIPPSL